MAGLFNSSRSSNSTEVLGNLTSRYVRAYLETGGPLTQGELSAVSAAYGAVFLVGVLGNLLVAVVLLKVPHMRNPTNYLLLNLSVADLLFLLVCMPVSLIETWVSFPWILGEFVCYFSPYMEFVTFHASTLTIMVISVERYYVICKPLHCKETLTGRFIASVLVVLWPAAFITSLPVLFITRFRQIDSVGPEPLYTCETDSTFWAKVYLLSSAAVFYFLPIVLLSGCCLVISRHLNTPDIQPSVGQRAAMDNRIRSRKQVTYMLLAVAVLFFICLLPYRSTLLGLMYAPQEMMQLMGNKGLLILIIICRIMVYINSTVNPILYNITSTKFRRAFKQAIGITAGNETSRTGTGNETNNTRRMHARRRSTAV
ncbi:PREDICTED: neuromedin-U receptor 2-like [Branchiostoma belcheri]|uniref:Neuromedin-U receptor 2-like n=1 Tax=Branchiostoma belcheri TaxID=7741 RepID=A0A6P4XX66_BRABE|nr:PREDICTED: neuromedin-U receptor 2-like [Branchiostoma belcheri]